MKGFYSPIDQLAAQLPRTKGTGAEFLTELSKRPGYKPVEAEDRNLQTLMALPKMERAKFLEALKAKPPVMPKMVENDGTDDPKYLTPEERNYGGNEGQTFHEQYTLPGGKNYREILLQHPQGKFKGVSEHFGGEPNILASIRAKDRKGPNGEKILHIEEIQSDWHQQGRDKGYLSPDTPKQLEAAKLAHLRLKEQLENAKSSSNAYERKLKSDMPLYQDPVVRQRLQDAVVKHNNDIMDLMPQVMKAEAERRGLEEEAKHGVPDAPFKKNWHELALKKMIHHAAEKGYTHLAITPGAEQAKRYGLSERVKHIAYHAGLLGKPGVLEAHDHNGNVVVSRPAKVEELPSIIGKELAQKLILQRSDNGGARKLSGVDLDIGGEGMKGFYDKMVPDFLNKFGKKYGAQVGTTQLAIPRTNPPATVQQLVDYHGVSPMHVSEMNQAQRNALLDQYRTEQKPIHSFPITPEMRKDVLANGLPLYAEGGYVSRETLGLNQHKKAK